MKGIHLDICQHYIYIKEVIFPFRQQQRRMNLTIKDIVKIELHKLLDAGLIYPISNSEWVSLVVVVQKKYGKWRICVNYIELNKASSKYNFPLIFIDQVLYLVWKKILFLYRWY